MANVDANRNYYVTVNGEKFGPLSGRELCGRLLTSDMLIWWDGQGDWVPITDIPEFSGYVRPDIARQTVVPPPRLSRARSETSGINAPPPPPSEPEQLVRINTLLFTSRASLTWSFLWRLLLVGLGSASVSAVLGATIGYSLTLAGCPLWIGQLVCGIAGMGVSVFFLYLYARWVLTGRLGAYRIRLVNRASNISCDFRQLPAGAKATLTWSFFWRSIVIGFGSALAGGVLGSVTGFAFDAAGLSLEQVLVVSGFLGVLIGLFFLVLYIQWLLSGRLGPFRLAAVRIVKH